MPSNAKMDTKEFVKAYMDAYDRNQSTAWLANQLGVKKSYINGLRARLRQQGVTLPLLRRPRPSTDNVNPDELNKYIQGRLK